MCARSPRPRRCVMPRAAVAAAAAEAEAEAAAVVAAEA
jgi:hypothetical protein